ncbi:hypothetical protein RJD39_04330 [Vibrio scophthalmi]|uniref:hypothetical protein n=1 Tax=Vibrio scophthalmi TaxID=45658 RepID=UPI003873B3DC
MLNTSESWQAKLNQLTTTYGQQMYQSALRADANGMLFQYKRADQIKMVTKMIKLSVLLYLGMVVFILLASPTFRLDTTLFLFPLIITFIPTSVIIVDIMLKTRPTYYDYRQQRFTQGRRQRSSDELHTIVVRRNCGGERYRSRFVENIDDGGMDNITIELHCRSPMCKSFGDFRFGVFQNTELAFEYASALAKILDFKGPVTIDRPYRAQIQ